jgi:hypothetical protein
MHQYLNLIVALILSVTFSDSRAIHPSNSVGASLASVVEDQIKGKNEYEFMVGEKIRNSLLKSCSIMIGVVGAVRLSEVEVTVEQQLYKKGTESNIALSVDDPARRSDLYGFSPWNRVETEVGKPLLFSTCDDSSGARSPEIVVSDARLIESIKELIEFDMLVKQNASYILQIPGKLKNQSDSVFAGYSISLLRGGAGNSDSEAVVISEILKGGDVIPLGLAYLRIKIRLLLTRDGEAALAEITRDTVFSNLIAGTGSERENADEIFRLFFEVAERRPLNLNRFVNGKNHKEFLESYRRFKKENTTTFKGQLAFEKQLKLL